MSDNPDYKRALKVGETIERTTDANGQIVFDNLDQGTYILRETKSLPGYQMLLSPITITLPVNHPA